MTLTNLIKMAHKYKGLSMDCYDNKKINKNLIDLLSLCIKNNITLVLNERDIIKIIEIYYSINHIYYDSFIESVIKLSKNNIDIKKIFELF